MATLNGHGTANEGRAHSYFEHWLTGSERYHEVETAGSALPNCATASFANQNTLIDGNAGFIVNDAAP